MIITAISAQNVLKYETLDIQNIPEKGLIAIDGPNESGKSTIGETICFALFGRSFSLGMDELQKLIRWGEARCSANLQFKVDATNEYEVARFIDRDGNHGVRLNLVGQEDQPIAKGIDAVENSIYELLGYGYDEFIESFYLAQREITTPHPHSYAVKAMAGISSLEYVSYELEEEIEGEQESIEALKAETSQIQDELDELDLNEQTLPALEEEKASLIESQAQLEGGIGDLDRTSTQYQDAIPQIRSARGARGRAKFFRFIFFVLAVLLGGAWALLKRMPTHDYTLKLQAVISEYVPQWSEQYLPYLLYAAIACGVLFLLFWISVGAKGGRIRSLQEHGTALAEKLSSLHEMVPERPAHGDELAAPSSEPMDEQVIETDSTLVEAEREADEEVIRAVETIGIEQDMERPDSAEISGLCQRIGACQAQPVEVRDSVGRELAWMRRELQQQQEGVVRLEQQIWQEQDRLQRGERLQQTVASLNENIEDHQRRVYLRELSRELLEGATQNLSQRFNRDLRDLVGRTLPMFTEGRYEHLQIDEDLTVRVFSSEKRDFMDLEEISSGTQRQIMLAVRLALSQELVNGTVQDKQFLFLDEPFAFFDKERTRRSLNVLPDLSDEITQVWVIAQEFPTDQQFDQAIHCQRGQEMLVIGGTTAEST